VALRFRRGLCLHWTAEC